MASRQEEKEARRRARLEQEEKERKAQSRRRRVQLVFGGLIGVAIVAALVFVVIGGAGGGNDEEEAGPRVAAASDVKLPPQQESDVEVAAKAAGCDLEHPPNEGAGHETREFTPADYKTNPPTSGAHFPQWAQDGIYDPGNSAPLGELVHSLEHGRINVQYKPGTPQQVIDQLEAFVAENGGYHMLLYENTTDMPYQVAVTAWNQLLGCDEVGDKTWDALRTFRDRYIDKGPEQVP